MRKRNLVMRTFLSLTVWATLTGAMTINAADGPKHNPKSAQATSNAATVGNSSGSTTDDGTSSGSLKKTISEQQAQIEKLTRAVELLEQRLDKSTPAASTKTASSVPEVSHNAGSVSASQEQVDGVSRKVDRLNGSIETLNKGIAGFRFSGDLRYRYDGQFRSGNSFAAPLQNSRERYRLRFNVNKSIDDRFDFHLQLGSGTFSSQQSLDTDFSGIGVRGPIFISEYFARYHKGSLDIRGGKMEEVFADGSRFFFDDDIRFNGFQEIVNLPLEGKPLGLTHVEFRAGEYILTNPNVQTLASSSAFVGAGFTPGQKVRDANLFHPGVAVFGSITEGWSHQLLADFQWYRNANQIQLASTAAGFPLLVNGYYGLPLLGAVGQTGNATTTPGGAVYTAHDFLLPHLSYRIAHTGWKTSRQNVPVWLQLDASRNIGTSFERNAWMATLNVGEVKKFGDVRFLYLYGYKQANSMISQVTDDDLGTSVGVNIKSQNFRIDLGLTKFLQWQNLLFIQNEISPNDPARNFYVPLQRGANTQYRVQSQFQFTF
jgi:hypothetical protein